MKLLKGDIVHAPALGALETIPDGALLLSNFALEICGAKAD